MWLSRGSGAVVGALHCGRGFGFLSSSRYGRNKRGAALSWLAVAFFVLAVAAAWAFSQTERAGIQQRWAGLMATSLGLSLVLWGLSELSTGRALVYRQRTARQEHPVTFWIVLVVFRFLIAAVLALAGLWRLL